MSHVQVIMIAKEKAADGFRYGSFLPSTSAFSDRKNGRARQDFARPN
jgi:hypothetical protein